MMKFYLSLLATISVMISLIILIIKNKNELLSNKLNLVISISLFICIIILSVITVSFGLKLSD